MPESVLLGSTTIVWLVGTLHLWPPKRAQSPPAYETTSGAPNLGVVGAPLLMGASTQRVGTLARYRPLAIAKAGDSVQPHEPADWDLYSPRFRSWGSNGSNPHLGTLLWITPAAHDFETGCELC